MAVPGSIRRKPHSHSGAARLWQWARTQRSPWTCGEAAEAAAISQPRCYAIVAALHKAGILGRVSDRGQNGLMAARWQLSEDGRQIAKPPIMIVDRERGVITGVRC